MGIKYVALGLNPRNKSKRTKFWRDFACKIQKSCLPWSRQAWQNYINLTSFKI